MEKVEQQLEAQIDSIFPTERYNVYLTGTARAFEKGTHYLIENLVQSLGLAVLLIALFMAYLFKSIRMILIALIPNVIPLVMIAGCMGYLGVPIKPSTILVFSIAFGISVDDTIHFLAKYKQELKAAGGDAMQAVRNALGETGLSMFYTSVVLFAGFSTFLVSSFGGTVALGGLVSATLIFAMAANLLLLPALLITFRKR